ncbi:MAG: PAS domain-containing protein [Leptolyngbya sp. BL-A-14]
MTFRFPAPLAQAIEAQAKATGRDRTTVVAEALAQMFGLALPTKAPITIEMLQQQVEQVESSVTILSEQLANLQHVTRTDSTTLYRLELLEQFGNSLKALLATTLRESNVEAAPHVETVPQKMIELIYPTQEGRYRQQEGASSLQITARLEPKTDLLARILAMMPDPLFVCDRAHRLLYINPLGARSLGVELQNALQQTIQVFDLTPDVKAQLTLQFETVFMTGRSVTSEISFTTPLYGLRDYEYTLSPIQGTIEHIDAVLFSTKDITERKRLEAALRVTESNY